MGATNAKRARRDLMGDNEKRGINLMPRFVVMGLFDFLRRKEPDVGPQNTELLAALQIEKMTPFPASRANLLRVLGQSTVCVAVRELPPELRGEGPFVLQEDIRLTFLTSTNREGQSVALVFSDKQQVQARKSGAASIEMSAKQAARIALQNGNAGMIVNPSGDWAELTRAEVEQLANGKDEGKLTSK